MHILGGMDAFARALLVANDILEQSDYLLLRQARYSSFSTLRGQAFEEGKLSLEDLVKITTEHGEPSLRSGRQELFENIINQYL